MRTYIIAAFVAIVLASVCSAYPYPYDVYEYVVPQEHYRYVRALPEPVARPQRQAGGGDHHDVVDYGAHTGHHGAFGWYADFPVHTH